MIAMTLSEAQALGLTLVLLLAAAAVGSMLVAKSLAKKAALATILGLLALLVWTQRSALDECADTVQAAGFGGDATCSFLGREIEISTDR